MRTAIAAFLFGLFCWWFGVGLWLTTTNAQVHSTPTIVAVSLLFVAGGGWSGLVACFLLLMRIERQRAESERPAAREQGEDVRVDPYASPGYVAHVEAGLCPSIHWTKAFCNLRAGHSVLEHFAPGTGGEPGVYWSTGQEYHRAERAKSADASRAGNPSPRAERAK